MPLLPNISRFHRCVLLAALITLLQSTTGHSTENQPADNPLWSETCQPCEEFDRLNSRVRDGETGKEVAKAELQRLLPSIREYYYAHGGKDFRQDEWAFPLAGYTAQAIAGGKRHGYEPRGYDWFAGNRHTAHPSLDIFIRDRNQDERDDRTGAHVPVLSVTGGIVVAVATGWQASSRLRGGNYVWIYDPSINSLLYYAHNRELEVTLGTIVKPGDRLATVGRSGLNAAKRRSPTHLHLTWLNIKSGNLIPEYPYQYLINSLTRQ